MSEPSWFYADSTGAWVGPFPFGELQRMVAGGAIVRTDLVAREGETCGTEAGSVPGLFGSTTRSRPPVTPSLPEPAAPPLPVPISPPVPVSPPHPIPLPEPEFDGMVGCEKCRARISDLAETCPRCGHPQPPLEAKQKGWRVAKCIHCRTTNAVGDERFFFLGGHCRGCGRTLKETNPEQVFEYELDSAYWDGQSLGRMIRWWMIPGLGILMLVPLPRCVGWSVVDWRHGRWSDN